MIKKTRKIESHRQKNNKVALQVSGRHHERKRGPQMSLALLGMVEGEAGRRSDHRAL